MNEQQVRIEVTIAAPVDTVWHALRDRETLREWHGWHYEEGSGLAGEIDEIYHHDDVRADEVAHRLEVAGGDVFTVEPHGAGAKVTLTRAAPGDDPDWAAYYDDITEGWITFLHQLRFLLERRPAATRRTLFFSGAATSGPPVDALHLAAVADQAVGARFQAELAGEQVTGAVWFRSEHQLGLTVDSWGPGLLVVAHSEPSERQPAGGVQAVLSTFDADAATHEALDSRWTKWWGATYPS